MDDRKPTKRTNKELDAPIETRQIRRTNLALA